MINNTSSVPSTLCPPDGFTVSYGSEHFTKPVHGELTPINEQASHREAIVRQASAEEYRTARNSNGSATRNFVCEQLGTDGEFAIKQFLLDSGIDFKDVASQGRTAYDFRIGGLRYEVKSGLVSKGYCCIPYQQYRERRCDFYLLVFFSDERHFTIYCLRHEQVGQIGDLIKGVGTRPPFISVLVNKIRALCQKGGAK